MTPSGGRGRPAAGDRRRRAGGPSPFRLALAVALLVAPAPASRVAGNDAPAPRPQAARAPKVPTIFHKNRNFRIPFNVDPADRPRLKEVQLWVSDDLGFKWAPKSRTTPDRPAFTFRSNKDGEYWFAVRTLDNKGQLFPSDEEKPEPSMKVVVDTSPPSIVLEPYGRRGSLATVRWEVRDEHLDLGSLVVEYQTAGAREWRSVPVTRPALIGSANWDAGTVDPIKVRASIADRAGNVSESSLELGEGTPSNPGFAPNDGAEFTPAAPISQISTGPAFPDREDTPRAASRAPAGESPSPLAPGYNPFADAPTPSAPAAASPVPFTTFQGGGEPDPFNNGPGTAPSPAPAPNGDASPRAEVAPAHPGSPAQAAPEGPGQTLLVPTPRFALQYDVADAGEGGPASVELWVTPDGGRHWSRRGEDPDKASPLQVDVGGDGTFGLRLVARSASGLGDTPPAPGDPPQMWVEVDNTAPRVQLYAPKVGSGDNLGKVAVMWRASDLHLGDQPVTLSWRPADQPGAAWQPVAPPLENSGKFIWTAPANVPPRFHLRIDVVDTVGNRGYAETTEGPAIVVDRARPRSRIIGLDPSALNRSGAGARSLR